MVNESNFRARGLTELTGKDHYTWHSGWFATTCISYTH